MARLFATSINLNKNELQNARIQNLSSNPSTPVAGQIYFNTVDNELRYWDGSQWISGSSVAFGNTASRPAASKAGQLYVDTQAKVVYVDNGSAWVQGTLNESDVQGWISDHNDLTSGVHGVTGDVVGTSDTQSLSNKTFQGPTYFQSGGGAGSNNNYLDVDNNSGKLNIHSGYALEIEANNDINITSDAGDIILNPDGTAYIGSANPNNRIVTVSDLESNTVVQSVSGTLGEVEVTDDGNGNVTVGLPDNVTVAQTLTVGNQVVLNDGLNNSTIDVDGNNLYINANNNLQLSTANGNITLNPDGYTQANGTLKAGDVVTGWIYGNESNGNIDIADWNENSAIHIDGTTHNIELLPGNGGKSFYGSAATAGNEIAKISDLQALSSGLSWKQAVNLLADTGQNFAVDNVGHSIDGHPAFTLANAGYRILLTGQTNPSENGIYELYEDSGTLLGRRTTDADTDAELQGAAVFVMEGNTYAGTSWVQNNHYVSGFANQEWVQFSGQGTYIGSDSIYLDGRSINVVADPSRGLDIDGDGVYVKIGNGIEFDGLQRVAIKSGTGFDITSGTLEFASGYGVRKYSVSIGNNTSTTADVNHNFNTKDVTVTVFDNVTDEEVFVDVKHYDNKVTITTAETITTNQYRVVVVG